MGMMKAVALSSGVVWVAVMVKWSVPVMVEFVPVLWSWVVQPQPQPPYLYLLINCIILSIVASSKLKLHPHPHPHPHMDMDSPPLVDEFVVSRSTWTPPNFREDAPAVEEKDNQTVDDDDEFVISRSTWTPPKREMPEEYSNNSKPPVSARFAHRKAAKPTHQAGKAVLRVSRPKRQETLDSTWRAITEGRPMPLKRHLKKSDTFSTSPVRVMKKSETFAGGSSSPSSGGSSSGGRLTHDELNRRVEAFISKFNEEMRLQRQESLSHYREMVGRGVGVH